MFKSQNLFDEWNVIKQNLHNMLQDEIFVNPRDIQYAKIWINVWYEQDGKKDFKRPVLVIKKLGNLFLVLPMTTKGKENSPWYYKITSIDFGRPSFVILSQLRVIDKLRFVEKIWSLDPIEFQKIKNRLQSLIF